MSMRSHLWARRTSVFGGNDIQTLNRSSLCIEKRKARGLDSKLCASDQ
jgi:hypothetical protein